MAVLPGEEDRILGTCYRVRHAVCTQEPEEHFLTQDGLGLCWNVGLSSNSCLPKALPQPLHWQTGPSLQRRRRPSLSSPAALDLMIPTNFLLHSAAQGPGGLPIKLQEDTFWALLVP